MKRKIIWFFAVVLFVITVQAVSFAQDNRRLALPSGIEVVEEEAFAGLSEINEIELPWGIREIGSRAFTGTSAGWVYLPSSFLHQYN